MRTWLILVLLAAVSLSGCAGEESTGFEPTSPAIDDTEGTDSTDSTDSTDDGGDGTDAPASNDTAVNTPPTASLEANATEIVAGQNVTFTVDGSDDDGDALTWSLTVDGTEVESGDALPATPVVTFDAVGNFTVELTVTDGTDVAAASETVTAVEGDPNAGLPAPVTYTGTVQNGGIGCTGDTTIDTPEMQFDGWTFTLSPDETYLWSWQGEGDSDPTTTHEGQEGTIPAGTTSFHICLDGPAPLVSTHMGADYTFVLYAPGYVR